MTELGPSGVTAVHPWKLREAARRLHRGGIIAYPTESVFGLGCDPWNENAVQRLLELKHRPVTKGLILIAADFEQLSPFVRPLAGDLMAPVFASWPGPHTWLLPAAEGVPGWITGVHDSLAVRVTDHPIAAALSQTCRSPLVSTSANIGSRPPARNALSVRLAFPFPNRFPAIPEIDYILHGSVGGLQRPTPIRDALTGSVLRA